MVAAEAQWVPDLSGGREFSLIEIELYNSEPVFLFDLFGLWPTFQLG